MRENYIAEFNGAFCRGTNTSGPRVLPVRGKHLDLIFSLQRERTVNKDSTVHMGS